MALNSNPNSNLTPNSLQQEKEILNSSLTNPAADEQKKQASSNAEGFIDGAVDTLSYAGQYALDTMGSAGSAIAEGAGVAADCAGDLASGAAEVAVDVVCSIFSSM